MSVQQRRLSSSGCGEASASIVRAAIDSGLRVIPVPGASSLLTAVAAAGLGTGRFRFVGFLPAGARERERVLRAIGADSEASVVFEAPHRIRALIDSLAAVLAPA